MFGLSFPYLLIISLFSLIAICQLYSREDNKIQYVYVAIVDVMFILFIGFRGYVMHDWYLYKPFFDSAPTLMQLPFWNGEMASEEHFEPLYIMYNCLIKTFTSEYETFVLINTIIDLALLHLAFRRFLQKESWALFLVTYLAFNGFTGEMDLLRNTKSTLLFLISIKYIEERRILPFILLNLLALGFHWSALVYFPLYFLIHKAIKRKTFIILSCLSFLIIPFSADLLALCSKLLLSLPLIPETLSTRFDFYSRCEFYNSFLGFGTNDIMRLLIALLFACFYPQIRKNVHAPVIISGLCLYFFSASFGKGMEIILKRVAPLFLFAIWLGVPILVKQLSKWDKILVLLFFLVLSNMKVHRMTCQSPFFQYDNTLIGDHKTYEERKTFFENNINNVLETLSK